MAESTRTLTSLRREICTALQMPFFRRYKAGYLDVATGSTTIKIVNASLTQRDKFWNGSWFYSVPTQETSLIRFFASNDNSFSIEVPLAATPSVGDDFEIHSGWNSIDVHAAINRSILDVGRIFPVTNENKDYILQMDKLEYDLTTLTIKPWIITKIFVENRGSVQRGSIVSATATTFVVENSNILAQSTPTWKVSIYEGTGAGQIRTIDSFTGVTGNVTAWTTTPDSTSRYAIWDANEDLATWTPIDGYRLDNKEFPSTLYIYSRMESHYGMRLSIEYMSTPTELTAEADTSIVPASYIVPAALSFLYGQRIPHTKADKEVYYAESKRYLDMAEKYMTGNRPHRPDIRLQSPDGSQTIRRSDNPLGWG